MYFFLLLIVNIVLCQDASLPQLTNHGCTLINDKVYYFGGKLLSTTFQVDSYNQKVYSLDMSKGIKTESNLAPIQSEESNEKAPAMINPYSFSLGNNSSKAINFYIFDEGLPISINYYDAKRNSWSKEKRDEKYIELAGINKNQVDYLHVEGFNIVQSDVNVDEFFIFGGFYYSLKEKVDKANYLPLIKYDQKLKQYSKISTKVPKVSYQSSFVYKGDYYIIGGKDEKGDENEYSFMTKVNIKKNLVNKIELRGDAPNNTFYNFETVRVEDSIYFFNSYYTEKDEDQVYVLYLNSNEWEKKTIFDFKPKNKACSVYNNGVIISSFGFEKEQATNSVYLIDVNNNKLVDSINSTSITSSQMEASSKKGNSSNSSNTGVFGFSILLLVAPFIICLN
ncbi:hypothetical protein K502DRAFT_352607 [Neoconidiobolus thromboides FSU 785]|nr:hypothetical protein K502DRAFT_352607 [Neoconidiobolus thromboides FSU 785]